MKSVEHCEKKILFGLVMAVMVLLVGTGVAGGATPLFCVTIL